MSKVIRFHLYYLFTLKTKILLSLLYVITLLILFYLTRFYEPRVDRIIFSDIYAIDFFLEALNLLKLTIVSLSIYIVLQLWFFNPYDIVLIQLIGRRKVFISKVFAGLIPLLVYTILSVCLTRILAGYFNLTTPDTNYMMFMVLLSLFTLFYYVIMIAVSFIFQHILSLLILFIMMMIGNILVDFLSPLAHINKITLVYHSLFINIHIIEDYQITSIISPIYIIIYIAWLLYLSNTLFSHKDF
ncbi:hypothetical protein [Liberiplasma polymorphum]|uniref:hypothetical protein n=1 Tax=Liberiplasma polymorphum TaxID=3374570 RepID=UPI003774E85E